MGVAAMLTAEEAAEYWDERHETEDDLRSGGDLTYDHGANEMFYAVRLAMLLEIIGLAASESEPLFLLDAGCGKGWFSRALVRCGHRVDAVDASEPAIRFCRQQAGPARYFRSHLSEWHSPWLYDVVLSIDVLFHILEGREWEMSVRNLASLVRTTGRLIVSDWGGEGERAFGNYQLVRGRDRYLPLVQQCGLRFDGWRAYGFRDNPIGLYVFTRVS
jgi:2-polyprenyl-3-methyl-5-hydroxy-6-metoxy-1,4-benzoquinol methylase